MVVTWRHGETRQITFVFHIENKIIIQLITIMTIVIIVLMIIKY